MKTRITTTGRIVGFAIAVALFTVSATAANAQEKGAARLLQLNAPKATAPATTSDYKPMSCAHCKDAVITVRESDTKGAGARTLVSAGAPSKAIAKHLCNACSNEWVVSGHGKATTFQAVHKCASCL
jgi:hypothetical protein